MQWLCSACMRLLDLWLLDHVWWTWVISTYSGACCWWACSFEGLLEAAGVEPEADQRGNRYNFNKTLLLPKAEYASNGTVTHLQLVIKDFGTCQQCPLCSILLQQGYPATVVILTGTVRGICTGRTERLWTSGMNRTPSIDLWTVLIQFCKYSGPFEAMEDGRWVGHIGKMGESFAPLSQQGVHNCSGHLQVTQQELISPQVSFFISW